jgi:hypothetical protein
MGNGRDPLDPLGQEHAIGRGHALEAAFYTAVLGVHTGADMGYVLSRRLDQVLDRLEDAGADRSIGKGEDAFPRDVGR